MKHAMDEFKADLREADEARRAVRSVVGDVLAQDSAEGIYGFALDQMKVDRKDVKGVAGICGRCSTWRSRLPSQRRAWHWIPTGVEEKFVGASRQIQVM